MDNPEMAVRGHYRCFDSLMARLVVEQAIPQSAPFGRSYPTSAWQLEQNCRGLTLNEVASVDFNLIDLQEWYDLMVQSENLPDSQDTMEEWT